MRENEPHLSSSLTVLRGVGPALAEKLKRLNLQRVEDLLFLLPLRYEDRTTLHKIGSLRPGMRGLVSGEVLLAETVYRGRRSLLVRIGDGSGQLTLRFFYFSRQQQSQFRTVFGPVQIAYDFLFCRTQANLTASHACYIRRRHHDLARVVPR